MGVYLCLFIPYYLVYLFGYDKKKPPSETEGGET